MSSWRQQRAGHQPQGHPPWSKCSGLQWMGLDQCTKEKAELLRHSNHIEHPAPCKAWEGSASQAKERHNSLLFNVTHQCLLLPWKCCRALQLASGTASSWQQALLLGNPSACCILTPGRELWNFLPANPCHNAFLRSGGERHSVAPWRPLEAVLEVHDIFLMLYGWNNLDRKDLHVEVKYCCHHRAACS